MGDSTTTEDGLSREVEQTIDRVTAWMVEQGVRLAPGESMLAVGGAHALPLLRRLVLAAHRRGAYGDIILRDEQAFRRILTECDTDHLRQPSPHMKALLPGLAAIIDVDPYRDHGMLGRLPPKAMAAWSQGRRELSPFILKHGVRVIYTGYPTPEQAAFYGVPFDRFEQSYWRAADTDYAAIARRGAGVAAALDAGEQVVIRSGRTGGDPEEFTLTLSIAGRSSVVDDGVVSPEDVGRGFNMGNLPCGEVFLAPQETSAAGKVCFQLVRHHGWEARDLVVEFRDGRVVGHEALMDRDMFAQWVGAASGDADRLGELGIGLNPDVSEITGYTLLDEKIGSTIHLALGDNRGFGGQNQSSLHWDLLVQEPTVEIDGRPLMERGCLVLPEGVG